MGSSPSKTNVLVIGLSSVGKTHLIDLLEYNGDTTKFPTQGFHVGKYKNIQFIEYGFLMSWESIIHPFHSMIVMVRIEYSLEQILESKAIILKMCQKLPDTPLCIVFVGEKDTEKQENMKKMFQIEFLKDSRTIAEITLDFNCEKNWKEGLSRLIEWITLVNGTIVKTK